MGWLRVRTAVPARALIFESFWLRNLQQGLIVGEVRGLVTLPTLGSSSPMLWDVGKTQASPYCLLFQQWDRWV